MCAAALNEIDPAAHNFKVLLRHVVSRVMDAIPSKLLDTELGIAPAAEVEEAPSDAQQAKQAGMDGDPEEVEEDRQRLPLFSHKVMTFVQHLLKYKVGLQSKHLAFLSPEMLCY